MGFIDLVGVSEENLCDVKYRIKNISLKPNSAEEHSIAVDIEVEISCRVFENKEISIIQDMYSPSKNLKFEENKVSAMVNMRNTEGVINIRDKVKLEEPDYTNVCEVYVTPVINETETSKDKIKIDGDVNLNLVLTNNSGNSVITSNQKLPFDYTQEVEGLNENSRVNVEIVPTSREFVVDNMEVKTNIDLAVNTNSYNLENINVIDNIEEVENEETNPYSMVIYFVKPGDTLWKIAKKYKSTVDDIVRVNNIENPDKIDVGMQLFIPKSVNKRTDIKIQA